MRPLIAIILIILAVEALGAGRAIRCLNAPEWKNQQPPDSLRTTVLLSLITRRLDPDDREIVRNSVRADFLDEADRRGVLEAVLTINYLSLWNWNPTMSLIPPTMMCPWEINSIIMNVGLGLPKERRNIVKLATPLIEGTRESIGGRASIISAVRYIHHERRQEVIELAMPLMIEGTCQSQCGSLLKAIADIPDNLKEQVYQNALQKKDSWIRTLPGLAWMIRRCTEELK